MLYNMKNKMLIGLLIAALMQTTVFAAEYKVESYPESGRVYISGNLPSEAEGLDVLVQVVEESVEADLREFSFDNVIYASQLKSGEDGAFTVEFASQGESGKYNAYISTKEDEIFSIPLCFANSTDNKSALAIINDSAKNDEFLAFKQKILENEEKLAIRLNECNGIQSDTVISMLKLYTEKNSFEENEGSDFISVYKALIGIQQLNESKAKNVDDFIFNLPFEEKFFDTYEEFSGVANFTSEMTSRLTAKSISDMDDAKTRFYEALALSLVKYPGNYSKIKGALDNLKNELNMDVSNVPDKTFKAISGNNYSSISELKIALGLSGSGTNGGSSGSSGGGNSGGNKGSSGGSTISVSPSLISPSTPTEEITKAKYDDLNLVSWATEAITALSDKGVLNGKSERKFAPNDMVTREEFIKMLICTIGAEKLEYSNHFHDVADDAWYSRYVNIAYEMEIVNGVGDGAFGIGNSITRQDMSVMLYNTVKYLGNNLNPEDITFNDANDIAGYAKNAVAELSGVGVINGYDDGTFKPLGNATRAEAACVIYRAWNYLAEVQ